MSAERKSQVIQHFDAWSAHYESEVWKRDQYFHQLLKEHVLNASPKNLQQKLLEMGVGTGIYLEEFILRTYCVTGIDISLEMLRISKKKLNTKGLNIFNLILADVEYLPFRNESFEVLNCIEVLRHLPEPGKTIWNVFREAKRVMKNSGSFLITIPNIVFPVNLFSVFYYIIPRNLMRLLHRKVGFQYSQKVSFPHFPVLYNEPEDHMYNLWFVKNLITKSRLRISKLRGIFLFPAVPKFFFPILRKVDLILGSSFWLFLAYTFFIKMKGYLNDI